MVFEESLRSIARDLKGVERLQQYQSGDFEYDESDKFKHLREDLEEEWEEYKEENNLDGFRALDGTFYVENGGGFLSSDRLTVKSAGYAVTFDTYEHEETGENMFEAEYLELLNNGEPESKIVPNFFRGFLDENFETTDE